MYRNVTTKCPVQLSYTNKNTLKKKKRAGGVAQGVDPEFKSQYHKKRKKATNTLNR
jgi:hypothetical protein